MTDEQFMKMAIAQALEGIEKGQSPFGACVVKNDRVICCVHNIIGESTDITAHAEVYAIREACKILNTVDLSGCIIYATCEPCPMCFSACHWAKISKIFYATSIEDAQNFGIGQLTISTEEMKRWGNSPIEIVGNFLREESLEVFKVWYNKSKV